MTELEADGCWSCPFAEKRDWSNEEDSGTDIEDCVLGHPKEIPAYEARNQLGVWGGPPEWCKLREGPVLVKLRVK
jgi:hypothetical protein